MKSIITIELELIAPGSTNMSLRISEVVKAIEKLGVKYRLTPTGTVMEIFSVEEAFGAIKAIRDTVIKKGVKKVIIHITIDDRRDTLKSMDEKIESVKNKIHRN